MRATLRRIGNIVTPGGRVRLRMSVGVHTGTFHFFLVGDDHRELLVTGPAATQTTLMEQTAEAGEIVVSPSTAECPSGASGSARRRDPACCCAPPRRRGEPGVDPIPDEAFDPTPSVPVAIREHLLGRRGPSPSIAKPA